MDRRRFIGTCGVAGALAVLPGFAHADTPSFDAWLQDFKGFASAQGISAATLSRALDGLEPVPKVLALDQNQPETTVTFGQYIDRVVSRRRIELGRKRLLENAPLLEQIADKYDVQPRFIVALWGIETDFGVVTGNFSTIASLATLAWSSPRPQLFRDELVAALKILDRSGLPPESLRGSWAGAMGQTQFMPSSYLKYAVDYAAKGRADIWTNRADVFASIANYLSQEGWNGAFTWGRKVIAPPALDHSVVGGKVIKPLQVWRSLGVRQEDGHTLPDAALNAGLVQPGGDGGPSLLVYDNYRVIMKWNRSTYFATAVSFLADQIQV